MSKSAERRLLFSTTIKDCDVETFCSGGPGGQHQNKTQSGVRIRHRASGAVGEAREHKSQGQNKKAAWRRMSESPKFQAWARMEAARRSGAKSTEQRVEEAMQPHNLRTEIRDDAGKWATVDPKTLTD